jgi:type VI secretion system protein ImpF
MEPNEEDLAVTLSLLDRLSDLNPQSPREPDLGVWEKRRQFRDSLCRDLAALLNTRRGPQEIDPTYEQANNSLLTFGIVDFTSCNLQSEVEQEQVRRSLERSIRQFEPRLTRVAVSVEGPDRLRPVLKFQVTALLRSEPFSDPLLFDVSLHRDSRRISVSGANS